MLSAKFCVVVNSALKNTRALFWTVCSCERSMSASSWTFSRFLRSSSSCCCRSLY